MIAITALWIFDHWFQLAALGLLLVTNVHIARACHRMRDIGHQLAALGRMLPPRR